MNCVALERKACDAVQPTGTPLTDDRLERVARFAASVEFSQVPPDVRELTAATVLYCLSVGLAAAGDDCARAVEAATSDVANPSGATATRLSDGARVTSDDAALCNASLFGSRAQGDSHPAGHLGGVVVPIALAIAEAKRLSGPECLASVVAGYDVGLRVGRDHSTVLSEQGLRTTPCYGVFAAAATAARALRFDGPTFANALRIAGNFAGGIREFANAGSAEGPFQAGVAARNGLLAARLALAGVRGAPTVLEGAAGFYRAYGGAPGVDYGYRLASDLGRDFEIRRVTYKPYPTCQYVRGAIRAVLALRRTWRWQRTPDAITIYLCPFEANFPGVAYQGPFRSVAQTIPSAAFCAALAWTTGTVKYRDLRTVDNPAVLDLVPRIKVCAEPSFSQYDTRVEISFSDGSKDAFDDVGGDHHYLMSWTAATEAAAATLQTSASASGIASRLAAEVSRLNYSLTVDAVVSAAVEVANRVRQDLGSTDAARNTDHQSAAE